jgi:MFS family permease
VLLLEVANIASGVGNAVVTITIPWLVLELTGSPAAAGLVAAAGSLPAMVSAPLAGWFIDRFGRRRVSIVSDVLSASSVAAFPLLSLRGELGLGVIIALAVLGATFDPAGYTARRALIPAAAGAAGTPVDRLNGVHEGLFAGGWTIGPLLGALLIGTVGAVASFWMPFALFLAAAGCMAALGVRRADELGPLPAGTAAVPAVGTGLFRGFVVVWRDRVLRTVTIAVLVLAAIYLPTEAVLLPTHFEQLGRPGGLGVVIASLAAGATIGAFAYGWLSARFSRLAITRMVVVGTAVSLWPMALLPPLPVLAAAAFGLGLSWGPFNPLLNSLVQRRVPAEEQGRVYGVQLSAFYAAPPAAMLGVGLAVERFGVRATYVALAALLTGWAVLALTNRDLRRIDD